MTDDVISTLMTAGATAWECQFCAEKKQREAGDEPDDVADGVADDPVGGGSGGGSGGGTERHVRDPRTHELSHELSHDRSRKLSLGSDYLKIPWDRKRFCAAAHRQLDGIVFDTVVGVGVSGAVAVPILAQEFPGVDFLIVRKDRVFTHSFCAAEGYLGKHWIFVDDVVDTGATLRRAYNVVRSLADDVEFDTTFVGAYLYCWGIWNDAKAVREKFELP